MRRTLGLRASGLVLATLLSTATAFAAPITINNEYTFELDQFTGAAVTYSDGPNSGVAFDGKAWDNVVGDLPGGVDGFTTGELAAGQAGMDPGDQLSFNSTNPPDFFQLDYGGDGLLIGGADQDTFVIYEISSSSSGVDEEGTNFEVSFNGGAFIPASDGDAINFATAGAENVNRIAFDLGNFGFNPGDALQSVLVRNLATGSSGATDPDFIFTALEGPGTFANATPVPEPSSLVIFSLLFSGAGAFAWRRRMHGNRVA